MAFAKIQTNFDLAGEAAFATVAVANPANVNLEWKTIGATNENQVIDLQWWIIVGEADSHQMPDPRHTGRRIISKIRGNESDSVNMFGINATELKIWIKPPAGAVGTLNLWVLNS